MRQKPKPYKFLMILLFSDIESNFFFRLLFEDGKKVICAPGSNLQINSIIWGCILASFALL